MWTDAPDPHAMLHDAVYGNRLIGIVIIILGLAMCVPAAIRFPTPSLSYNIMAVSASLFMIGPGVLYQIAAIAMNHREERGGKISLCVAVCMAIPAMLSLGIELVFGNGHFGRDIAATLEFERNWRPVSFDNAALMPPLATLFFVPASLVHAWNVVRAIRAIRLLPTKGHAFEVSVHAVQTVSTTPTSPKIEGGLP
jgi:hypothetical protein